MSFRRTRPASRRPAVGALFGAVVLVATVSCGSNGSSAEHSTTTGGGYTPLTSTSSTSSAGPTTTSADGGSAPATTAPAGGSTTPGNGSGPATTSASGDGLLPPSGTFLSSHRVSLSGNDGPKQIRSVCHTSPGAKCWLTFSKDGRNAAFLPKEVDAGGNVSWDWSASDLHLTVGHWDVTITAQRGVAKKTVDEAIGLEVVG